MHYDARDLGGRFPLFVWPDPTPIPVQLQPHQSIYLRSQQYKSKQLQASCAGPGQPTCQPNNNSQGVLSKTHTPSHNTRHGRSIHVHPPHAAEAENRPKQTIPKPVRCQQRCRHCRPPAQATSVSACAPTAQGRAHTAHRPCRQQPTSLEQATHAGVVSCPGGLIPLLHQPPSAPQGHCHTGAARQGQQTPCERCSCYCSCC